MATTFCTTNPGALAEAPSADHRIEQCIECRHTHWTTTDGGFNYCDQCRGAEDALS